MRADKGADEADENVGHPLVSHLVPDKLAECVLHKGLELPRDEVPDVSDEVLVDVLRRKAASSVLLVGLKHNVLFEFLGNGLEDMLLGFCLTVARIGPEQEVLAVEVHLLLVVLVLSLVRVVEALDEGVVGAVNR